MESYIIKETFDSKGALQCKQVFNKDTMPAGEEIEYYPNGKIKKWKWYATVNTSDGKHAHCIVYYDNNGVFDSLVGNPFILLVKKDSNSSYVKLINPPNINAEVVLHDSLNHKIFKKAIYEPLKADSVSWIIVGNDSAYNPQKGHRYILHYYVMDSVKKRVYRAPEQIELLNINEYKIEDIPIKIFPRQR